jgi:hypothetical protein
MSWLERASRGNTCLPDPLLPLTFITVALNPSKALRRGVKNLGTHKEDPSLKKAQDDLSWKLFMLKEKSAIVFMRNH